LLCRDTAVLGKACEVVVLRAGDGVLGGHCRIDDGRRTGHVDLLEPQHR
jgi:hypothetical protein